MKLSEKIIFSAFSKRKSLTPQYLISFTDWKLIDDSSLTDSLDSLAHRRNVSALSLYYRYYHDRCSDELKSVIPLKACFARSTRFTDSQQSFVVKLEKSRTTSFANTFVPMNSLPASIFPSNYNLQIFKTRMHKHLRLHPLT